MHSSRTIRALLLSLAIATGAGAHAQYFRPSEYWKARRSELLFGVGLSNFLGELGGRNATGTPFIWDLEMSQTRPAFSFGYSYYVQQQFSFRLNATYGMVAGNDALTTDPYRQNRNLSFRSHVFEGQLCGVYHILIENSGHNYDLRGVQSDSRGRLGLYAFAGLGVFHFNPQAQYNGTWVDLRPLGTEGQGLKGGPAEYALTGVCIPMGLGIRKALNKTLTINLELQYTKTFTDYIDDVSGVYYNNDSIAAARGPMAAHLADPSLGDIPGQTAPGQQRGQSAHKDGYMFLKAGLVYKLYKSDHPKRKARNRTNWFRIVF